VCSAGIELHTSTFEACVTSGEPASLHASMNTVAASGDVMVTQSKAPSLRAAGSDALARHNVRERVQHASCREAMQPVGSSRVLNDRQFDGGYGASLQCLLQLLILPFLSGQHHGQALFALHLCK
jgi:hypothetical protein